MEASARIVDAMRQSVAARGAAGSTFDQVAREAGVSRGLLHYHFGTKEKLLAEVVRRDSQIRLEHLGSELAGAGTVAEVIDVLVHSLEDLVERDPGFVALMFELFTSGRRNPEIAAEFAALQRATRTHVGALLAAREREGVIRLRDEPEALRLLGEPEHDHQGTLAAATAAARALIAEPD
jgi:AcrR family transcriptional regulator